MQTAYIIENKLEYKVRNSEFPENQPSTMITLEGRRWCIADGQTLRFSSTGVCRLYQAITFDSFQLPKSWSCTSSIERDALLMLRFNLVNLKRTKKFFYRKHLKVMFLAHKDESFKVFSIFCKRVQNEKRIYIIEINKKSKQIGVIVGGNSKIKTFKGSVKKVVFFITSLLQEDHTKMVLLRGTIDLFKR
ncbi:hypothetical protein CR513_32322, partial [Mucuna pruriens]